MEKSWNCVFELCGNPEVKVAAKNLNAIFLLVNFGEKRVGTFSVLLYRNQ